MCIWTAISRNPLKMIHLKQSFSPQLELEFLRIFIPEKSRFVGQMEQNVRQKRSSCHIVQFMREWNTLPSPFMTINKHKFTIFKNGPSDKKSSVPRQKLENCCTVLYYGKVATAMKKDRDSITTKGLTKRNQKHLISAFFCLCFASSPFRAAITVSFIYFCGTFSIS